MRYSDEQIEEVRSANNIVDVIGSAVSLKRTGSNYVGLCPFHNEKTPSFSVSESKQMYYCFGCHAGGNVLTFVMEYYQYSFVEALQFLAERAGINLPKTDDNVRDKAAEDRRARLLDIHKKAAGYYHYLLNQHAGETGLNYLRKRGLSDETIRHFGLGYAGKYSSDLYRYLKTKGFGDKDLTDSGLFQYSEKYGFSDKFWNRVMFPIMDVQGRVIGFGGRVMGEGKPKYLNSPETDLFNKRRHLYALNLARRSREKSIILCEGYMDVISMHQAGFTNAVASLGTALTPQQASLLRRYTTEVRLLYDSDEAGVMAALRAIPILREAGIGSRVVSLKPYKDPDELIKAEGAEGLRRRLEKARNAFLFEIDELATHYDRSDPQDETAFQHEVASRLLRFPEELERENYLRAAAKDHRIDEEGLRRLVASQALKGTPAETYRKPKETGVHKAPKEDSAYLSQKMMLTYLVNYPEAFEVTKGYIGPDDFADPLCHEIALRLYEQHEAGEIREASLLNSFPDPEAQKEIAGFFNTSLNVENAAEQDRAFTDTVIRLMTMANEAAVKAWDGRDMTVLLDLMQRKKDLEEMTQTGRIFHLPYDKE